MDQIAQQLKEELDSLQQYIEHTEKRLLATNWVEALLDPFEQVEDDFAEGEIKDVVDALYIARNQFSVNGHLADRVDGIIDRYRHLVDHADDESEDQTRIPAKDPAFSPLFTEEDEEEPATATVPEIPADTDDGSIPIAIDDLIEPNGGQTEQSLPASSIEDIETVVNSTVDYNPAADTSRENSIEDFAATSQSDRDNTILDFNSKQDGAPTETEQASEDLSGNADELFADAAATAPMSQPPGKSPGKRKSPSPSSAADGPIGNADEVFNVPQTSQAQRARPPGKSGGGQPATKIRRRTPEQAETLPTATFDIFSDQIDLDDLLLNLGIEIPEQDKVQLGHLRKQKLESRAVAALKSNGAAAGQYILVPRISRFIHQGAVYNCTVKNLARTFIALFADIKDLMQYKTHPFLDREVPELGWGIVTAEAPRDTLDKNYMEQAQYLRFLSTSNSVPSHMVRRRTLVEAVYDIIAGRLCLATPLQSKTLDWTTTGPSKSDFICVFLSEQGLRLRHLNRTQRNKALGLCPNW